MKRRWSILFWSSLTALIGVSWLAAGIGMALSSMMNFELVGMIGASAIAFFAMVRQVTAKWPAVAVLVCAGPLTFEMLRLLPDVSFLVRYFGASGMLVLFGTLATAGSAIVILVMKPPKPPQLPPVAPARVVD